ncbi:hypothetical protein GOBAR_AA32844 [Gossypium barbadense]|uniref:Uncharacterized protein n=1 Tax=Gossypium barbadense TaxID=3634 RepID=A0A2P5W9S2_GOSBA|nr:hypothetical protein GOBAR_AA32844 [Gossypium barbadense]
MVRWAKHQANFCSSRYLKPLRDGNRALEALDTEIYAEISIEELLIKYQKSFDNVPVAGLHSPRTSVLRWLMVVSSTSDFLPQTSPWI